MILDALTPFHVAFPVDDLAAARRFYGEVLGCPEGRSADDWIDFNLFGHQIVAHLKPGGREPVHANPVDGHDVPVPHFGVVLDMRIAPRRRRVKQPAFLAAAAGLAAVAGDPFQRAAVDEGGVEGKVRWRGVTQHQRPAGAHAGTGRECSERRAGQLQQRHGLR